MGFPCGSAGKESACNVGDLGSIPVLGRSPGERKGYPIQYSGLENSMDCINHGVTESGAWLSNFHFNLDSILKSKDITLLTKVYLVKAIGFSSSHVWMWELDHKESWVPKNWCFGTMVLEKTLESPLDCKEIRPVNPKGTVPNIHWEDWCWSWNSNLLVTWYKELTHWKRPWCWERLKARGEGDDRGWDGGMASPTQWTWVWVSSGIWWWTRKPGVLQSMGSWRVGHDWETWTELNKVPGDAVV